MISFFAFACGPKDKNIALVKKEFQSYVQKNFDDPKMLKEIVEIIAKSLVDNPSAVVINEKEEDNVVIYELHVATEDMGKVIGKQGRIAKALRTVVKAAATREDKKVNVEIIS